MAPKKNVDLAQEHIVAAHALEQEAERRLREDLRCAELLDVGPSVNPSEKTRIGYVKHLREVARLFEQGSEKRTVTTLLGEADRRYWDAALSWQRLARSMARGDRDMEQEYLHALFRAAQRFEPRLGFKFSTYGVKWIRAANVKRERPSPVRVPGHAQAKIGHILAVQKELGTEDPVRIAQRLGLEPETVIDLLRANKSIVRLDAPQSTSDERRPVDLLEDESMGPEELADTGRRVSECWRLLDVLEPREREILRLLYGLDDGEEKTLQQVAARIGLSKQRVSQIQKGVFRKLRERASASA